MRNPLARRLDKLDGGTLGDPGQAFLTILRCMNGEPSADALERWADAFVTWQTHYHGSDVSRWLRGAYLWSPPAEHAVSQTEATATVARFRALHRAHFEAGAKSDPVPYENESAVAMVKHMTDAEIEQLRAEGKSRGIC